MSAPFNYFDLAAENARQQAAALSGDPQAERATGTSDAEPTDSRIASTPPAATGRASSPLRLLPDPRVTIYARTRPREELA
jgi:hypothetical protein